jgi:hypothetical protein
VVYDAAMSTVDPHWLFFEDAEDYDRLREVLLRANYTVPGVLEVMGQKEGTVSTTDAPLVLHRTGAGRPIDTLMRLFLAKTAVDEKALRDAIAPMSLELWEKTGLVTVENGSVITRIRILPFDRLFVAQEIFARGSKLAPDFVVGVGAATITMVNFMVRRRSHLTLDMGTGCGLLALLKSGESDKVIAADRNPRAVRMTDFNARINGLANIECVEGDLFEPVAGLKFDLILSNAPFVISPSSGYLYLDGGMQGDQFCQRLVRGAAQSLTEGGYFQFLCNWAHLKDQNWQERLAGWFKDTGCDVWVLHGATEDPGAYARKWINHIESEDSPEFPRIYNEWTTYYERERIEAISMGLITIQRASAGPNWFRIDPQPEAKSRDLGEDIIRIFEVKKFLSTVESDEILMKAVLRPSPELRLELKCEPSENGWNTVSRRLLVERGLAFVAQTDELACAFIAKCNGKRNVREALLEISSESGLDAGKIAVGALHVIRHLLERGFLLPAQLLAASASDTVSRS